MTTEEKLTLLALVDDFWQYWRDTEAPQAPLLNELSVSEREQLNLCRKWVRSH